MVEEATGNDLTLEEQEAFEENLASPSEFIDHQCPICMAMFEIPGEEFEAFDLDTSVQMVCRQECSDWVERHLQVAPVIVGGGRRPIVPCAECRILVNHVGEDGRCMSCHAK